MKTINFEKKGNKFEALINEDEATLEFKINGMKVKKASAYKHHKGGWGYGTKDLETVNEAMGLDLKKGDVFVKHETGKEAFKILDKAKKEKKKRKILSSKINLSYYYGDWYRVNALFIDGEVLQFNNEIFKNKRLKEYLANNFYGEDGISEKLDEYLQDLCNEEYAFERGLAKEVEKIEGITVEYKDYDDLRGKGTYVSDIIFDSFEIFEKFVEKAYMETIELDEERKRKEKEKLEKAEEKARKTGKNIELRSYSVECNDPDEECNVDIITIYMTPSGRTKEVRSHTW